MICIDGVTNLAGEKHSLSVKLGELRGVVQKVTRPKPPTDLGREIAEFFSNLMLEKEFQKTEKDEFKYLVFQLTKFLQDICLASAKSGQNFELTQKKYSKIQMY